ncbi:MAG: class I SAM-dependent methyltransferase [Gammaproteobacteria bacterium]|nr:class I SAM-dependent methyltransferase [Gammaproteobacteria bacterium]
MAKLTSRPRSAFDFGPLAEDYENWYSTADGQENDRIQQHDVLELINRASPGDRLLDVGCGTGHWSGFFRSLGYKVHGIDISEKMIRVAKKNVPECTFEIANACNLPYEDASFEIVASMAMLEFTMAPIIALREMARCIKPGGNLLIGTLNRLAPLNQGRISRGDEPYASGHLFSPHELHKLLSMWGQTRMLASLPTTMQSNQSQSVTYQQETLDGPFMVAVMQR